MKIVPNVIRNVKTVRKAHDHPDHYSLKAEMKEMVDGVLELIAEEVKQIFIFDNHFKRQGYGSAFFFAMSTSCVSNLLTKMQPYYHK